MASIAERVAKGAALLDQKKPGWFRNVDLDKLDINARCDCIIGQTVGRYSPEVLCSIGVGEWDAWEYGFITIFRTHFFAAWRCRNELAKLEGEWRRVIVKRRADDALSHAA